MTMRSSLVKSAADGENGPRASGRPLDQVEALKPLGRRARKARAAQWVRAIYEVMTQKRSNIQLGIEVQFSYQCPVVRSPKAIDLWAESWKAMSPIIAFVLKD